MAKYDDDEQDLDLEFTPEPENEYDVVYKPAVTSEDFTSKAKELMSNTMDVLNHKIKGGMAEASDLKTAVEIAKMYKIGMMTVEEAAAKAMAEAGNYSNLPDDADDHDDSYDDAPGMRFED